MKIVMTGGRGFIGSAVARAIAGQGHQVVSLTRRPGAGHPGAGMMEVLWDGVTVDTWAEQLDGADAVINLAGEPIAGGRWTAERKARIIGSRLEAASALIAAVGRASKKPRVWINASAVGYYGDVPEGDVTESSPAGVGFLSETCIRWESEALKAQKIVQRVVLLRTGIVLGKNGGALPAMVLPFRFFAGGPLGSGRQWMSWIHIEDVVGLVLHALQRDDLDGPLNLSAPEPVRMREFSTELGRAVARPSWLPVPAVALRLMLGEMSAMLLGGQRVIPAVALATGYAFRYPALAGALEEIFRTNNHDVKVRV